MTNLSLLSDKSEHVVTNLRLVRDKSKPLASQTHCVSLTSLSSTVYVATGWSPSKCRCNNGLCLSSLHFSACTPRYMYHGRCNCVVQNFLIHCTLELVSAKRSKYICIQVEKVEVFRKYLGGSSSTTGLQHLYTVPVQFFSPHSGIKVKFTVLTATQP